jgi:addiction module RelE/StbE family toxin
MRKRPKRIDFSNKFEKNLKKAPLEIKIAFRKRMEIFSEDPFSSILNNHSLTGIYKGYRSINITGNWRAIYSEYPNKIVFIALGTHSQLYK